MQREHLDWTRTYPFGPDMKLAVHFATVIPLAIVQNTVNRLHERE
jgi:hypothetical protein